MGGQIARGRLEGKEGMHHLQGKPHYNSSLRLQLFDSRKWNQSKVKWNFQVRGQSSATEWKNVKTSRFSHRIRNLNKPQPTPNKNLRLPLLPNPFPPFTFFLSFHLSYYYSRTTLHASGGGHVENCFPSSLFSPAKKRYMCLREQKLNCPTRITVLRPPNDFVRRNLLAASCRFAIW